MSRYFSTLIFLSLVFLVNISFTQTQWMKYRGNPIFKDTSVELAFEYTLSPYILIIDSTYHMWYSRGDGATNRICYATSLDGISWVPYINNPIVDVGLPGSWEATDACEPIVIYNGSTYHMWYTGMNSTVSPTREAIGYATSPDGINWTKYSDQPVLDKGPTGTWDDTKVFGFSVFFDGSIFHMWYSGGSTGHVRHIGYATSSDGFTWTKFANNPVLRAGLYLNWDYPRSATPRVVFDGIKYHMFYTGGIYAKWWSIGYASSPDKINWTKYDNNPVLDLGEPGSWDDYNVCLAAVKIDTVESIFRMWYSGNGDASHAQIGYAVDFSNSRIAHSDNISLNHTYFKPTADNLMIDAHILNPQEHTLSARAHIVSNDAVIIDSTNLVYEGENIWNGTWPVPEGERSYIVGIKTLDEESGNIHNGLLWNIERFTTIGPIVYNGLEFARDTIPNPGDLLRLKLIIKNKSVTATAPNISATLSSPDSFVTIMSASQEFGDIAPGESIVKGWYMPKFSEDCPVSRDCLFRVDIYSDIHHFWSDEFVIHVFDTVGYFASSFFAENDEGWTVSGDAQGASVIPDYVSEGGNLGGYISAKDNVAGGVWYWKAPEKFLGKVSNAFGKRLTFDLRQSSTNSQFDSRDIILESPNIRLIYDTPYNPETEWTRYDVLISDTSGWKIESLDGLAPTYEEMNSVLDSLTNLFIRGEYVTGSDRGDLDNVILRGEKPPTDIDDEFRQPIVKDYIMSQNYPNPFNPSTNIEYSLPVSEHVTITVYNTLGQTIETLVDKHIPIGHHQVEFNGQNLPSGVYFYRIEAGEYLQTRKMLLVR